jgi:hypothetical protein
MEGTYEGESTSSIEHDMFKVNETEFYQWLLTKPSGPEMERRWKDSFDQKIKEINWQEEQINKAILKIYNILNKTPYGQVIRQYLRDSSPELRALEKEEELNP